LEILVDFVKSLNRHAKSLLGSHKPPLLVDTAPQKMDKSRKSLRPTKEIRNIVLFVSFLLVINVVAIKLWAPQFQNFFVYSGASETSMLSDLLFGEGAAILGVGALLAAGASKKAVVRQYPGKYCREGEMTNDYVKDRPNQMRAGVLLMITGAVLIGLAITIGTIH